MKLGSYSSYTPRKLKKLGDALLIVSGSITAYAVLEMDKTFALISLICGIVGKLLLNFVEDENTIVVRKEDTSLESNNLPNSNGCVCNSEECICKKD